MAGEIEVVELESDSIGEFDALAVCTCLVDDPLDQDGDSSELEIIEVPQD